MNIVFTARDPCGLCGYRRTLLLFCRVRVNKRSVRTLPPELITAPQHCPECRTRTPLRAGPITWQLEPDDAAKLTAHRYRRWPELRNEVNPA